MSCPNVNSPEWKALVGAIGVREAYREFLKYNAIPDAGAYPESFAGVNATLKVVKALNTDKMQSVYKRFYDKDPGKFYSELGIIGATKEQVQLLKDWNAQNNPQSLSEMTAGIAAEMTYTVEINVTTDRPDINDIEDMYAQQEWGQSPEDMPAIPPDPGTRAPTSHYSGMTVDGGTNYRENEIRTPEIVPVRQGHAAFSTPNGIGWFRSDDKILKGTDRKLPTNDFPEEMWDITGEASKTRRILEVQSDLFQKNRSSENLARMELTNQRYYDRILGHAMEPEIRQPEPSEVVEENRRANSFLQLLNKDNNWVTFFVKSIIQDSARKGYESVLFPAGDTASKVEGHETLEQFLANTSRNIELLQKRLEPGGLDPSFNARVKGIQDAAKSNREHSTRSPDQLSSAVEHPINPSTIGSQYNFARIRQNYYQRGFALHPNQPETLTGDNYDGWVLYEYTVGRGNKITKLTADEAQQLINKDNERGNQRAKEDADEQEANAARMIADKENILAGERENVVRELEHLQQEYENARAGRTQLSSIANFYENTIQNILSKQQFAPVRITDEYGNDWFKVNIRQELSTDTIFYNKVYPTPKVMEKEALAFLKYKELIDDDNNLIAPEDSTISQSYEAVGMMNHNYYEKYGFDLFRIEDNKVSVNSAAVAFNKDSEVSAEMARATINILDRLQQQTGLPYEIISEDESGKILGDNAEGTKGFYLNGKVYILDNYVSPDNAFHEYAHPFVMALRLSNPQLYAGLVAQLRKSPEGNALINGLSTSKDYNNSEAQLHDEAIVRMMTEVAEGQLALASTEAKGFWSKLWFAIKQALRKWFGQNVDLSKLDENTSLSELANILLNKKINLPRNEADYALFNRDIANEMKDIDNSDVMKSIETFHRVAQDHLVKTRENKNYAELREILKNQADGSILNDLSKLLTLSKQKEDEIEENRKQLLNFAKAIVGARIISDKMKTHVIEMGKADMDERDKLRIMRYYSFISNDWLQAFEQLREVNKEDLPLLGAEIQKAYSNFQRINDNIAKAFKGGLVATFKEQLAPINENIENELGAEVNKVRKLVEAGDKKLQRRLEYLEKMKAHGTFDDEKILKLLQGELGDTNFFSSLLESYTSSPDPIVGGFAAFVNKELYKVEAGVQEFTTKLGNELDPLYKQYGVDISKPEELGQQLVFKDTAFTKDEEGKPKGHEVYTFLHEFGNGYQFDYQNLQSKIDEAKEGGDRQEAIKLQKEFDQLKKDYFHREYVDEVYAVKDFWNESDINRLAQQRRKDITDQLASYEAESGFKDLTNEDRDHIDQLLRQLKTLSSTKNLDGTDKDGEDLGVAQAIQEYNKRMWKYREEMAMKGAFERDLQSEKDDLLDKGLAENSQEYRDGLNAWLKANIRVRLSDKFYTDRDKITDEIASIVNKLGQDEAKKLDISLAWKEMFEQVKGFRDQDNQPIGSALTEDKIKRIHQLQDKINDMVAELRRQSGLTGGEAERYSELWGKLKAGIGLDPSESQEFNDFNNMKDINGLSKDDKARLMSLFEMLKDFQSKIPTEYYIEAANQKLKEGGMQESMGYETSENFLDPNELANFFEANPDNPFTKWFMDNHTKRVRWNPATSKHEGMYERLYVWNRIVPNDENFKTALATNDYQSLLAIKNPYVEIKPAAKYFFYRIKNEYRTKRVVGQTIDNRGNWLPKTLAQGAKDGKYANKQYFDLKSSTDPKQKALYQILETYKKYHLQTQEEAPRYGRLWYELPRVRKERIENLEALAQQPLRTAKNLVSWAGSLVTWKSKPDAFDSSLASKKDLHNEQKMYVATDLFGNEINSIPMKYMSKLDTDVVSLDIGRSVIKYALALQINKTLHEVNPFAQALKQTLAQEGIKSINKVSKQNWFNKLSNIPVLDRNNTRLKTINNMIERDIEGVENKMELGLTGSKIAQHLMGVAAFGSLALNLPAGIKNVVVAKFQNLTESVSKEFFTPKNLKEADKVFMNRFMPKLMHDYNRFAGRSLETQMFELFDFVQGKFEEHVGESFSASYKKDIAKLRFTRSFQALGELQAQGQAGLAMLIRQQVPWAHGEHTTMINYLDAWELRDGAIQLREGVDKSWGKNGANFAAFKLKVHKINELMQGAYAKMNQAEATRYTAFKMVNFMRRYLTPGIVNRFSVNRNNFALGTQREGYYTTFLRVGRDLARDGIKNWAHLTDKEKRNVYKTLTEMGYSLTFLALMSLMGYNSDDPDKNKKLKNNSWAFNMALYEVVMIKGELENFIPFPGMGMNEILRMKDQPSIAFPLLNKYYKIISHLIDLVEQPLTSYDIIHYRRSTGIWHKGDLKIWADLLKAIGYTGATVHPDVAIKNYMATTNRYN